MKFLRKYILKIKVDGFLHALANNLNWSCAIDANGVRIAIVIKIIRDAPLDGLLHFNVYMH